MSYCCIFAGQGAQIPGMGKDFAEADAEAMALFDKANAVLGFDLKKICFEGPAEELTKSNVCQPAIFVTSYAAYLALQKRRATPFAAAATRPWPWSWWALRRCWFWRGCWTAGRNGRKRACGAGGLFRPRWLWCWCRF